MEAVVLLRFGLVALLWLSIYPTSYMLRTMENLATYGVSFNVPNSEFTAGLRHSPATSLAELRSLLFYEAKISGLTDMYSVLVRRLDKPVNPVKVKKDIYLLLTGFTGLSNLLTSTLYISVRPEILAS